MKNKIFTIVGARPQFIKAAAVSRVLCIQEEITEIMVHTGQHYDHEMSDIFFKEMKIPQPKYHLGISGGRHGEMTARMLSGIEALIVDENPALVLVYGDTNSTLAGALAAVKLHVPVAHVEAGLRSHNMLMPEEVNRILTDSVSQLLFCPTAQAVKNLELEGYASRNVQIEAVGDVMQDAAYLFSELAQCPEGLKKVTESSFIIATIHRAENTDSFERLSGIVEGLNLLNERHPVILPLHPRTRSAIAKFGLNLEMKVLPPLGYLEMIWLLGHCQCVVTDSGGLQKEAFFFSKPCVTIRNETEWLELVEVGANVLAAAEANSINQQVENMIAKTIKQIPQLYGGGIASKRIVSKLMNFF